MGKSEVDRFRPGQLSFHCERSMNSSVGLPEPDVKEGDEEGGRIKMTLPQDMVILDNQVAGHMNDGRNFSMLKYKGFILKPIVKKSCSDRESNFYEELNSTYDTSLKEMRELVPNYYGREVFNLNDTQVDCLILEDLTRGYKEPCIMDIKIGRRTWDPLASYQKILKEEGKYHDSKRDVSFCIPGFQVYKLSNGKLRRYGKEYGRKLNKDTIVDAFKTFLNAEVAFNRNLLVQLLVNLWKIQNWARKQTSIRLYSSSILLIYDARRLRQTSQTNETTVEPFLRRNNSLYRPMSLAVLHDKDAAKTGFSGQLGEDGPVFPHNVSPRIMDCNSALSVEKDKVHTLKRIHSFQNNFDEDLQNIRSNYIYMLDDLVCEDKTELWATAKMIDFAHMHHAEDNNQIDHNYLQGIENLVKIFEGFLAEI